MQTLARTSHFFSFRWRTLLLAAALLGSGFAVHLYRAGVDEVAAEWSVLVSFTLAPLGAAVLLAFLWNLGWAPVLKHRTVTREVRELRQRWENEKPRLLIQASKLDEYPDPVGRRVEMLLTLTNRGGRDVKRLKIRGGRANENDPSRFLVMLTSETQSVIPSGGSPTTIRLQPMMIQYETDESGTPIPPANEGRYVVYERITFWDERDEEFEEEAWFIYIPSTYKPARGTPGMADAPQSLINLVEPHMLATFGPISRRLESHMSAGQQ